MMLNEDKGVNKKVSMRLVLEAWRPPKERRGQMIAILGNMT